MYEFPLLILDNQHWRRWLTGTHTLRLLCDSSEMSYMTMWFLNVLLPRKKQQLEDPAWRIASTYKVIVSSFNREQRRVRHVLVRRSFESTLMANGTELDTSLCDIPPLSSNLTRYLSSKESAVWLYHPAEGKDREVDRWGRKESASRPAARLKSSYIYRKGSRRKMPKLPTHTWPCVVMGHWWVRREWILFLFGRCLRTKDNNITSCICWV